MTDKDIIDFINANFTAHNNVDCHEKLSKFVCAMNHNQYYPITEEEIRRAVKYKKEEGKALLKVIDPIIPEKDKHSAEAMVENLCNQCLQQLLNYKHTYEKQNNHVV